MVEVAQCVPESCDVSGDFGEFEEGGAFFLGYFEVVLLDFCKQFGEFVGLGGSSEGIGKEFGDVSCCRVSLLAVDEVGLFPGCMEVVVPFWALALFVCI